MVDIAVVGAGTMGAGIAESAALAGLSVVMVDVREEAWPEEASGRQRNVLEPHLAAGDLFAVIAAGDHHLPELLDLALHDGLGDHFHATFRDGPQEIGAVAHPHGELSPSLDRG
jgi:glycine/D-amino acid oxidase-like deaminating enzyme